MDRAHVWADSVSFIPILPGSKKPAIKWEEFQKRRAATDEREEWKRQFPGCNWAIVTGEVSGLLALDWDKAKGRELRKEKNVYGGPASITPSGGFHTLHTHPGRRVPNGVRLLGDESGGLDIRGDGGYIVCPPSTVDGKVYKREIAPWMVALTPAPDWVWPLIERGDGSGPNSVHAAAPQPDGLPPGVGKGQRNQTMAQYAGRYLRKGCTAEETFQILRAVNQKFRPPLSDEEVRRIVFSIARRERDKAPALEVMDGGELATAELAPPRMLIEPFFPEGGKAILAGPGGGLKSTLALNVAYCHAGGFPLFGQFHTAKGRAVYVDAENTQSLAKWRQGKITRGLNLPSAGVTFVFPPKKLDLAVQRNREELCRIVDSKKATLLVLDSFLALCTLRNENDNTEVRNFLELLGEIPKATGASLLVLDHSGKRSAEKVRAGITMTPRGASARHDWADLVTTFEKRDHEARVLRVLRFQKTRFCAQPPALVLDMGTNLVFCASGEDEACPVFTVREAVAENPGIRASKLYAELMSKTGCSKPTAIQAVKRAETLGYIDCREFSPKHKEYHPMGDGLVKSGHFTNIGEGENADE